MTLKTVDSPTFSQGKDLTHYLVSRIPLIFLKRKESRLFCLHKWETLRFCSAAPPGEPGCVCSSLWLSWGFLEWGPWVLSSVSQSLSFPIERYHPLENISFRSQFSWFPLRWIETTQWKDWRSGGRGGVWQLYYCIRSSYTGLFAFHREILTYWMQHTFPSTYLIAI